MKKSKPKNITLKSVTQAQIKQLRSDARKLIVIAKHLKAQAQELADEIKATERAEQAQANFYSKNANIDSSLPLTPIFEDENIKERRMNG